MRRHRHVRGRDSRRRALEAEKHFYEEGICILDGQGPRSVARSGRKQMSRGAVEFIAPPLIPAATDQGGRQPVSIWLDNAPLVMDIVPTRNHVNSLMFFPTATRRRAFFNMTEALRGPACSISGKPNFIMDVQSANLNRE